MSHESASDIPGADERRREQERIRREYPDLYYYVAGVALVVVLMLVGYVLFPDRDGYLTNLFTEAASVAVTLIILNRMAERREERRFLRQLKQDLIYRMGSQVNSEAIRAVEELRRHGWLLDGSLHGARFSGADLRGANLVYANLTRAVLVGANLSHANLWGANLPYAQLWDANLSNANLGNANLSNAVLYDADCSNVDLTRSSLSNAIVGSANLSCACLRYANLSNAFLGGVNLSNAILKGVNLEGATVTNADANLVGTDMWFTIREGATLPNGDTWHPGYDMTIFTNPPDGDASDR